MAQEVVMPQMGESIAEGTVTTWLKKVGERVERDEPLFEISTDKVDAEIPSPVAGTLLEIKVQPGQTVPINSVVAIIGDGDGDKAAPAPAKAAPTKAEAPKTAKEEKPSAPAAKASEPPKAAKPSAPSPKTDDGRPHKSSPVVRKIAAEHQVDISSIEGSGIGGRVTRDDIMAHIEGGGAESHTAEAPAPRQAAGAPASSGGGGSGQAVSSGWPQSVPEAYRARQFDGDRTEELNTMRSKIAEHMVVSKHISAHTGTFWEVDFTHAAKLRAKHKQQWEERYGVNLTYTAFIMKATVDALKAFPSLNASLDGRKAIFHRDVNLGVAVALDWGLIVPVVHKADELNLLGLARRTADLAARARTKKLKPEEVQSGTFTITNPGIYGPMFGLPIINQPQVGILGVGAVEKRPVVIDDMIAIRTRAYMSMSFDHRLVDGATADQFMARIKKGIEEFDPSEL